MFSAATKSAHGPATAVNYIEDVFSTWLYTGTGASQTITNNIDLSTKGGMTWIKSRSAATNNNLFDTTQGATKLLHSNRTDATATDAVSLTAFNTTGFTLGTGSTASNEVNVSAATYCSWSFRKQAKFFDIVTYNGNGAASQTISHNLGATPGFIVLKTTIGSTSQWFCWHKNYTGPGLYLNSATLYPSDPQIIGTTPTSTSFVVNDSGINMNATGYTYVAYLFAHDAGGFGLTGTDNVVTCGGFTADGSGNATVNLGYEPQYILTKRTSSATDWQVYDVMRGLTVDNVAQRVLYPNLTSAEGGGYSYAINSTGFSLTGVGAGNTFIYMAIRRPMKVPTDATTVFSPIATSVVTGTKLTTGFPIDLQMNAKRASFALNTLFLDRLRGISTTSTQSGAYLISSATDVEASATVSLFWDNTGYQEPSAVGNTPNVSWNFSRRPGFFDVVCTSVFVDGTPITHNLGVTPELIIVKTRSSASNWMGAVNDAGNIRNLSINTTSGGYLPSLTYSSYFNATTINPAGILNGGGGSSKGSILPVVIYLFATVAGVSKVGTYTGNGTTQAIACGFTGGARFVLIKRTDSTGDWYVYDTARGMTTLTDPYLLLNSSAAEAATLGSVTTTTGGFTVNATILAAINTNAASYIFLAIA